MHRKRGTVVRTCGFCAAAFEVCVSNGEQVCCSRSCAARLAARARPLRPRIAPSTKLNWRTCVHCARWFVSRQGRKYCSDECRRVHGIDRIMALYRTATSIGDVKVGMAYFRLIVNYLAQRDGIRCAICRSAVDLDLKSGPRGGDIGPSIDHVVPRSKGGTDDLCNLRLTHWHCNRARGNRGGGEQLQLVG